MEVTEELRKLRQRAKMSMAKMAQALDYKTASGYQRYENATLFKKEYLPVELVGKLLKILPGKGQPPIDSGEILRLSGIHKIDTKQEPGGILLFGLKESTISSGAPVITAQQVEMFSKRVIKSGDKDKYLSVDESISQEAFCLIVTDDSMAPEFKEGESLICDPLAPYRPGDFVIAKLDREIAASIRRYRIKGFDDQHNPIIELVPLNPDYPPLTISSDSPGKIYARVVEHRRKV